MEQINTISIIRCSCGDPHTMYPTADPWWNDERPWNECVRGDGMSYGGVVGTVERLPGESDEDFFERFRTLEDTF